MHICGKQLRIWVEDTGAYEIFDLTGRSHLLLHLNKGKNSIDVSTLADGWYFMLGERSLERVFKVNWL